MSLTLIAHTAQLSPPYLSVVFDFLTMQQLNTELVAIAPTTG